MLFRVTRILFALAFAIPVLAQSFATGDVFAGHAGGCFPEDCREQFQWHVVSADGVVKRTFDAAPAPYQNVVLAAPDRVLFPGLGEIRVLTDGASAQPWFQALGWNLTNVVPTRSGDYLVGKQARSQLPRLVRLDRFGNILAEYLLPADPSGDLYEIELFADQCTVAWLAYPRGNFGTTLRHTLHAFDICKNTPLPDLLVLDDALYPYFIRQLPGGDLLIATYTEVRRFDASGQQIAQYPIVTFGQGIALTPDGLGCWYAVAEGREIRRVDFAVPDVIVARSVPNSRSATVAGVVGEWHGSLQPAPPPRRRSSRH